MRAILTVPLVFAVATCAAASAQPAPAPPAPAQAHPAPGFVSTYEVVRTLRDAGFDPVNRPLREGSIYVARATDYRGILMRVVLDARTGAIRDANRIVPGPGARGPYGYGAVGGAPYGPLYGGEPPPAEEPIGMAPPHAAPEIPPPSPPPSSALPRSERAMTVPLPRRRPPQLAAGDATTRSDPPAAAPIASAPSTAPAAATAPAAVPQTPAASASQVEKADKPPSTLTIKN